MNLIARITTMEVKQGFYIGENLNNNHYLILDVDNKHIKVVNYGGTPLNATIFDYENLIADGYTIDIMNKKDVDCTTKYNTYLKNGIPSSYPAAIQYRWSNKEYTIPLKPKYWNGSKWAEIPEGFYG